MLKTASMKFTSMFSPLLVVRLFSALRAGVSAVMKLKAERKHMKYDLAETGKRIREVRKMNGLTQEEFSSKVNISTTHIGSIERGFKGCSIELLVDIAIAFNVSLDFLILGKSGSDMTETKTAIRNAIEALVKLESTL